VRWTVSLLIVAIYFSVLLTKNYNNAFEFVKVIIQNIFDDITITSALRNNVLIFGKGFLIF